MGDCNGAFPEEKKRHYVEQLLSVPGQGLKGIKDRGIAVAAGQVMQKMGDLRIDDGVKSISPCREGRRTERPEHRSHFG